MSGTGFGILDARSGTVSGSLPCGVLSKEGELYNTFVVHEMTGMEEDILTGKGAVMPRLNKILTNCTDAVGDLSDKDTVARLVKALTAVDRMVMLIGVRRASLGDKYPLHIQCPDCDEKGKYEIDLAYLEQVPMKEPKVRKREDTIASGKTIHWHIMSGYDEEWLQSQIKRLKNKDMLTLAMLARVDKIDDYEVNRVDKLGEGLTALKKFTLRERNEVRELFKEHEGSIDTEITHECPQCSKEFSADLDVGQPGFFFPAGMPSR
jgi:hypothetical protein